MGHKSKINLNSFINDTYINSNKISKPKILSSDKLNFIKKQMFNNDTANFTGYTILGEDGLKIISDTINSFHSIINTQNNTLASSITLGNLNTGLNYQSNTPNSQTKKNFKFTDLNFSTIGINHNKNSNLSINNENFRLKELRLCRCNIGDEGFALLANCLDKPGSVQVLNLKGNKIKDK